MHFLTGGNTVGLPKMRVIGSSNTSRYLKAGWSPASCLMEFWYEWLVEPFWWIKTNNKSLLNRGHEVSPVNTASHPAESDPLRLLFTSPMQMDTSPRENPCNRTSTVLLWTQCLKEITSWKTSVLGGPAVLHKFFNHWSIYCLNSKQEMPRTWISLLQ